MSEYNNQSIDIDLEEMFDNLSDKDQERNIFGILMTILLPTLLLTPSGKWTVQTKKILPSASQT